MRRWVLAGAIAMFMPTWAWGSTISITDNDDTYISSGSHSAIEGSLTDMISNTTSSNLRWSYVQFNLSSVNMATVSNITFTLQNNGAGAANDPISVYGLLQADDTWGESTLTWDNDPNRNLNALNFANTYGGTAVATFTSHGSGGGQDTAFSAGPGSAVFNYINSRTDGLATFVIYDTAGGGVGDEWDTKEFGTAADRPILAVTVPEPMSLSLLPLTGLMLLRRRRAG